MKIIIEGSPIAKKRHKCACRGRHAIAYDPQIKEEMEGIRQQMLLAWQRAWESKNPEIVKEAFNLTKAESFEVTYTFLFPINKSDTEAQKNAKLWGFQTHNTKPDKDNLEKLYSDCGKGIFWSDDSQIVAGSSKKLYSNNPRTEIEIMIKQELKLNPHVEAIFLIFGPLKLQEFMQDLHKILLSFPGSYYLNGELSLFDNKEKEKHFKTLSQLLVQFSAKYVNDIKKISKINIEDSNEQEVVQAIEEGKFNI